MIEHLPVRRRHRPSLTAVVIRVVVSPTKYETTDRPETMTRFGIGRSGRGCSEARRRNQRHDGYCHPGPAIGGRDHNATPFAATAVDANTIQTTVRINGGVSMVEFRFNSRFHVY